MQKEVCLKFDFQVPIVSIVLTVPTVEDFTLKSLSTTSALIGTATIACVDSATQKGSNMSINFERQAKKNMKVANIHFVFKLQTTICETKVDNLLRIKATSSI